MPTDVPDLNPIKDRMHVADPEAGKAATPPTVEEWARGGQYPTNAEVAAQESISASVIAATEAARRASAGSATAAAPASIPVGGAVSPKTPETEAPKPAWVPELEPLTHWYDPWTAEEVRNVNKHGSNGVVVSLDRAARKLTNVRRTRLAVPRLQEAADGCYFSASFGSAVLADADAVGIYDGKKLNEIKTLFADLSLNINVVSKAGKLRYDHGTYAPFGWHPDADMNVPCADQVIDRVDFVRWAWQRYNTGSEINGTSVWTNAKVPDAYAKTTTIRKESPSWTDGTLSGDETKIYWKHAAALVKGGATAAPSGAKTTVPSIAKETVFTRPNGERYFPRKVVNGDADQLYDVDMVLAARTNQIPVLLYGDPGTGKTALCEAALENLQTLEGTADTEAADFIGSYVPTGPDTYEWQDGPLLVAAENGWPLLIDEIAMIDPRVLPVVYSAMDGRGEINVTTNPARGKVQVKEGFYVIGACNPNVPGAVMSDALMSRFSFQIEVTTDYHMLKSMKVDAEIVSVAMNLAKQVAAGTIMRAPQTRELLAYQKIKETFGRATAVSNLISTADANDREVYITTISSAFAIKATSIKI